MDRASCESSREKLAPERTRIVSLDSPLAMRRGFERDAMSTPFGFKHADDHARLRDAFLRADFTLHGVPRALGVASMEAFKGLGDAVVERRTHSGRPIDVCIRLFLISSPVRSAAAERAFAPLSLQAMADAGLLAFEGDEVKPACEMLPLDGYWYAYDMPARKTGRVREDYVMGVGASSTLVCRHAVRQPGATVLDMGCGAGYIGFEMSRFADATPGAVVGVDRNARAIEMGRFNAALAGKTNCEFVQGDMFAAVPGRRFDLIVTNPPFVISPEKTYIFRDSGRSGDSIVQEVCGQFAPHLNAGGWASMVCNWAHLKGVPVQDRLRTWFAGHDLDVLVLTAETRPADMYAWTWVNHTAPDSPTNMQMRFEQWVESYEQLGIESVSAGIVVCRKRDDGGGPRVWFDDTPTNASADSSGNLSDNLARIFDNRHAIETLDHAAARTDGPRDWLGMRFRLAPGAMLEHTLEGGGEGAWTAVKTELSLQMGLGYRFGLVSSVLPIVSLMNGERNLAAVLRDAEKAIGAPAASMVPGVVQITRAMLERGFIEVAASTAASK